MNRTSLVIAAASAFGTSGMAPQPSAPTKPESLVFPAATTHAINPHVANADPLEAAIEARMHERLLKNIDPARQLSEVPQGIDSLAILRLSKERVGAHFQREVETLIVDAPSRTPAVTCEKIAEVFASSDLSSFDSKVMTDLQGSISAAIKAGKFEDALSALHLAVAQEFPKGFMVPPAPKSVWETAQRLFSEVSELSGKDSQEHCNEKSAQLLAALDKIMPGRYLGAERTKMLSLDTPQRLEHTSREASFFLEQQRRAFK
jgi:hypothetical protein